MKNFEDLEIWRDARLLTKATDQLTQDARFAKDFALRDQIRRAAVSIMSNIAEGFERGGNQEFVQFLYIAKGCAANYDHSFMWLSIKTTSIRRLWTTC